jgi:hypothetical protein
MSNDTARRRGKVISWKRLREKRLRQVLDEIARHGYDAYEDDDGIHYVPRSEPGPSRLTSSTGQLSQGGLLPARGAKV